MFATPITVINFEEEDFFKHYAKLLIDKLHPIQLKELEVGSACNTDDNLHTLPEFKDLVDLIDSEITMFFESYLGLPKTDTELCAMWANVQTKKGKHDVHLHSNSFYSGVVYLDVPSEKLDPGHIMFIDPRPAKTMVMPNFNKASSLSSKVEKFLPKTGMMLLFPSWLEHGTTICQLPDGQYRVSLSFNYILTRSSIKSMRFELKDKS